MDLWLGRSSYVTLGKLSVKHFEQGPEHSRHFIKAVTAVHLSEPQFSRNLTPLAYKMGLIINPLSGGSL